jgi:hypothetical protein
LNQPRIGQPLVGHPVYEGFEPVERVDFDVAHVLPSLAPADCVLTDPPYGIYACGGKWGAKAQLTWDREPVDFMAQVLAKGRTAIIWGGNYYALPPSRGWLVWRKPDRVPSAADCEFAWTNLDMNARFFEWTIAATNAERVGHPTQKPLAVMRWSLGFAPDAQTILDPFMGSGTSLVVAKRNGRQAIGIEIEDRYCEIAAKRLAQEILPLEVA